jgi:integrase
MRAHNINPKTIKLAWDKKANDYRRNSTGKIEYVCQDREPPCRLRYFSTDCDRVEDAQTFVRGLKADLLDHEGKNVEPTIGEIADLYLKDRPTMRQGEIKVRRIVAAFGDRRFTSLTSVDLIEYKAVRRKAPVNDTTLRNELSLLKTIRTFACKLRPAIIPRDKVGDLVDIDLPPTAKTNRRALTPDEIERVRDLFLSYDPYAHARPEGKEPTRLSRLARFGAIAIDTGARKAAIETLKWSQVNFDAKLIEFDACDEAVPFNKRRAKCPMSERLEALLLQAKAEARSEWVLDGPGTIERTFKAAIKGTEFEGRLHAHLFRHSFITHMLLNGNPVALVSQMVADGPQTLARYTHVTTEYARDNVVWGKRRDAAIVDFDAERAKRAVA